MLILILIEYNINEGWHFYVNFLNYRKRKEDRNYNLLIKII